MIRREVWIWALSTVALVVKLTTADLQPAWNETWTDKLKQHLLTNYDRFARPSQHYNTTTVAVRINIKTVEVNDKENVMSLNVWFSMRWNDTKLKWNSSEYGGLKEIRVAPHKIWIPDVYLLNSATHGMEYYGKQECILYHNGMVLSVTPTIMHVYCHVLDFTLWPFEEQICTVRLSSWTYNGAQVNLTWHKYSYEIYGPVYLGEWMARKILAFRTQNIHSVNPESAPFMISYVFHLFRSSKLYYHIIFIPTIPVVFLSLIMFWLQPQSQMKLLINASNILIIVLLLIYLGYKIPPRQDSMPNIVKFYSACLYQTTISLIVSTFVINIKKITYFTTIPWFLRRFLFGRPGHYLGLSHIIQEIESQKSATEQEINKNRTSISMSASLSNSNDKQQTLPVPAFKTSIASLECILLATAIDRLLFVLFSFTFIFTAISYIRIDRY